MSGGAGRTFGSRFAGTLGRQERVDTRAAPCYYTAGMALSILVITGWLSDASSAEGSEKTGRRHFRVPLLVFERGWVSIR